MWALYFFVSRSPIFPGVEKMFRPSSGNSNESYTDLERLFTNTFLECTHCWGRKYYFRKRILQREHGKIEIHVRFKWLRVLKFIPDGRNNFLLLKQKTKYAHRGIQQKRIWPDAIDLSLCKMWLDRGRDAHRVGQTVLNQSKFTGTRV